MKDRIVILGIIGVLCALTVNSSAMDRWEALSQIESGDCDTCIGPSGEVSRYQILPCVWREYTKLPLSAATNPFTARNVAETIMAARIRYFYQIGAQGTSRPTDQELYLLWHRPARVLRPKPAERERAERFENLCRK